MCLSAGFTTNPADAKAELAIRYFDVAVVISMNRQASGLTTGASEPVELEVCDYITKTSHTLTRARTLKTQ